MNKTITHLIACLLLVPLPALAQKTLPEDVYVVVNGQQIDERLMQEIIGDKQLPPDQFELLLQRVISNIVVAQEAEKLGFANNPKVQSEIELAHTLVLVRAYLQDLLIRNPVSQQDIQAEFNLFLEASKERREYRARHILVQNKDEAADLVAEVGGDLNKFIELAKAKSIDTGSGANGGELGWAGPESYVGEFSAAMTSMQPGEFSAPIQSQFGWHLIYLDEIRDMPIPQLDETLRQQIIEQLQQVTVQDEYTRLIDAADVMRNEKLLKPSPGN